jgi:8-amino-7-oxononanoate synthase
VSYLDRIRAKLAVLAAQQRDRTVRTAVPDGAADFSSNDYLGLARDPRVVAALHVSGRVGSGGSRLLGGAHAEHAALESALAEWTGRERARLFSSGYLAAIGAITALASCVDVAYSDELVHACMIDGLRLTKLERHIVAHGTFPDRSNDARPALIATESAFGMDGSLTPLTAFVARLQAGDVLLVDEAHALGVSGRSGSGHAAIFRDERVVVIGTLSKALGAAGGFVAGPAEVIELLTSTARPFIFDTALPPAVAAAATNALNIVRSAQGDALRAGLRALSLRVRGELRDFGYDVPGEEGPIVPVVLGSERAALALARALEERGVYAPAIRPPTVPSGSSRLRLTLRADHTAVEIGALLRAMHELRAVTNELQADLVASD